jgi:predicted ATPase
LTKKFINLSTENLIELPEMQDKEVKIIMQILMNTSTAAYWKHPNYGTIFSFIMLEFSIDYGNSHATAFAYSIYGVFLSSIGDFQKSRTFAELSLKLYYKFPNNSVALKIPLVLGFTIYNWIYHSSKSVELMMNALNNFHTIKDITYSSFIIGNSFHILFILGKDFKKILSTFM